jgi:uncharacterized caspase-like protein
MLSLLAMLMALALTTAAEARQVALVVGIGRYEKVEALKNPGRDAAAIADRLRDQGFDVIEAFDADRFALDRARRRFLSEARGADLALFYFAGHGIQLFDRNVLLVRDADPATAKSIAELGLDLNALMGDVRAAGPVRAGFLIDACRDNPLGFDETVALLRRLELGAANAGASAVVPEGRRPPSRGLSVVSLPSKGVGAAETLAFFAAQPGNVSFDGDGRNSYYVEGLLEALAQPSRPLTEVLRSASAYVRTVTRGEQVPQLVSDWTGDVVLGRAEKAAVRYLNASRSGGDAALTVDETRIVGEAARAYPVLGGTFIVKESQSFTGDWLAASATNQARAKAIGSVNGFAIDYDIDRDGRDETIGLYVRQTNVVMEIVDEGVSLLDAPCWDFDNEQIGAVEIALRDLNGDRRPEIFLHYQTEPGNWGNLCILEYRGSQDLAASRRGAQGTGFADKHLFRVLLRHEGAWTVNIGADNSIETCAGSNCHTRSAYTFDGTYFRMTLDQSEAPSPGKALPFRDHVEHLDHQGADRPEGPPASAARPSLPPPNSSLAAVSSTAVDPTAEITRWVAEVYLPSGAGGVAEALQYEPEVAYYGKRVARDDVLADKRRYIARWPRRSYRLTTGTVRTAPAPGGGHDVTFEYSFEVSDGKRASAGRGRTRLTLHSAGKGFVIAREEGEVLRP